MTNQTEQAQQRSTVPTPDASSSKHASGSEGRQAEETASTQPGSRAADAEALIRRNVYWSLGAGAIPLPLIDLAAQTAIEMKLLKELADLYKLEYSSSLASRIIYSLLASIGAVGVGSLIGGGLASLIPVVGVPFGVASKSGIAGAFTYGVGRVMLLHFEAGGTLLDFDPAAMRTHFLKEFERGKSVVSELRQKIQKSSAKSPEPAAS